jgi:two-component system sensor histidine kinase/response regulator
MAYHVVKYVKFTSRSVPLGDNGVGFDQQFSRKMLMPFHRLHSESAFEGTSIGPAIVNRIIRLHEGKIWADDAGRKGATIYFSLN